MQFLQDPPQRFNVVILEGYIWPVKIYPVTHFFGEVVPFVFVPEYRFPAPLIIFFYRNFFPDIFFSYPQFFLQLWQPGTENTQS